MRSVVFGSLRGYRPSWLGGDVVAGLTVWAVLVPEALAYATIAGVSPVVGLYAAPAALIFYAAFGSSRHIVVGPMSATAALSAATVGEFATQGGKDFVAMTAALAITVGLAALVAGSVLNFVATSGTSFAFSTDGGNNWTMSSGPVPSFTPNFLAGCGGASFVAADAGGNWAYSTDGGDTWASPTTPPTILQ